MLPNFNPFHASAPFLNPKKAREKWRFSDDFGGYRNQTPALNELSSIIDRRNSIRRNWYWIESVDFILYSMGISNPYSELRKELSNAFRTLSGISD